MSLRDQFLKAGIVDRKKLARANRDLKKARRQRGSERESKRARKAREAAEQARARLDTDTRRRREADDRRVAERGMEKRRVVSGLLRTHCLPHRKGQQAFWFVSADRKTVLRLQIPGSWAHDLRAGRLAIVWLGDDPHPERAEHRVLRSDAIPRVRQHAPERVLFWNEAPPPSDDPAEQLFGIV
ncbi:MAG: DUF2058 family protein [Myxococcota bacterium]|nr:DUF2058 family protein [Myxococcota bacterium]MEC8423298.1 DUF2058 family protein [Myxococcota bacterium]